MDKPSQVPGKTGKSLDEIAALLAENTRKRMGISDDSQPPAQPQPNEVTTDDGDAEGEAQAEGVNTSDGGDDQPAQVADDAGDAGRDGVAADQDGGDGEGDGGEAPDQPDDQLEQQLEQAEPDTSGDNLEFEIDDDTVFQIDDDTEVSYADLKQLYTAEKDQLELVKNQQQATQEALAERARAFEDSQKARRAAEAVFQHFEQIISVPLIRQPDESLKASNPQAYISQLEAFQQDQKRIQDQRNDLVAAFNQHTEAEKELLNNRKAQEIQRLADEVPALKDPMKKQEASKDILDAAEYFGFSPEEVNNAVDHRIYKMAYYAQQYLKILNGSKSQVGAVDDERKKTLVRNQTRTLRSRGTSAKNRQTAQANKVKAAKVKAKKSGRVDDVADFIAARSST